MNTKSDRNIFLSILLSIGICSNLHAQKTGFVRVNYKAGLQYYNLYHLNSVNNYYLRRGSPFFTAATPSGSFIVENYFKPVLLQNISLAITPFKNKTYGLVFGYYWSKDETTSYAFSADSTGNPLKRYSTASYTSKSISIGISKDFLLPNGAILTPSILFNQYWDIDAEIDARQILVDRTSGAVISSSFVGGTNGVVTGARPKRQYMLFFDNPRVGLEYRQKIVRGLYFGVDFSYQFAGGLDFLYSNATKFDFSGQCVSLGLSYKFQRKPKA